MKSFLSLLTAFAVACFCNLAEAQLTNYSQDFDALVDVAADGWDYFGDNGGLAGGYSGDAFTNGPQISALADDGGTNQFFNIYANYDNTLVHQDNQPTQEAISVFQQQNFTAGEAAAAGTWTFSFDYASNPQAPLTGDTTTAAFIRVFDGSFNLLDQQSFDTTVASASFANGSLMQTLNPLWTSGGILQFGFTNLTGSFNGSGRFYDNVSFSSGAAIPEPTSLAMLGFGGLALVSRRRRR